MPTYQELQTKSNTLTAECDALRGQLEQLQKEKTSLNKALEEKTQL